MHGHSEKVDKVIKATVSEGKIQNYITQAFY